MRERPWQATDPRQCCLRLKQHRQRKNSRRAQQLLKEMVPFQSRENQPTLIRRLNRCQLAVSLLRVQLHHRSPTKIPASTACAEGPRCVSSTARTKEKHASHARSPSAVERRQT